MAGKNKVKYNLKNVHYSIITEDEEGVITFGTPISIPGAVSISFEPKGEISKFYADGMVYYQSVSNNGYEGDLEIAMLPEKFETDVLGNKLDEKKILIENANIQPTPFALLFEFDGDKNQIKHILYNCIATRTSVESKTSEDKKEPVTDKLQISATPLANGNVKGKTTDTTSDEVKSTWYQKVYVSA